LSINAVSSPTPGAQTTYPVRAMRQLKSGALFPFAEISSRSRGEQALAESRRQGEPRGRLEGRLDGDRFSVALSSPLF
jgi:hypothetical protein